MWKKSALAIVVLLVASSVVVGPVAGDGPLSANATAMQDSTATQNDIAIQNAIAAENEAPLADAGLDQEVTRGATVLLDGTESRDPDGEIERYQWSIRTPNDATIAPDCADCARTAFTPSAVGEYRVTLTVTDDDGATRSDTLYVEVSPGTEPSISVSGAEQPTEGTVGTYTAELDAGTAALDYVVWTVDGTEFANHSLSADQASDEATKRFPTADERTVTATVYDVDGQSATNSMSVSVQPGSETGGSGSSPDDGTSGGGSTDPETSDPQTSDPNSSIADSHDPTVAGDAVVTGTKPLRGGYHVRLNASDDLIESVEWRNVAELVDTGRTLVRTWEPGDHTLYAVVTYSDGSESVATFSDGTTTVTADPKPNVSLASLDRWEAISGSSSATDEYENLASLRVEIDGETVASSHPTVGGREHFQADHQRTLHFSYSDFVPGESYTVTVVATDNRGQTTRVSRDVVPVKEPEIVRSEFVDETVDSYHERIDPSRYVAHHVLEVDLNGVDPENVTAATEEVGRTVPVETDDYRQSREFDAEKDAIIINTYWAGSNPGEYYVESELDSKRGTRTEEDTFRVTPSKPELRLDVLNDGTKDYITREHGILVNASGSFDPDGTDLKYIWKYGAEPTKPDNTTAKFDAYERAASIVEDEHQLSTERNMNFLSYFVPDVRSTTEITEGPYFPNETVRVRIETNAYHLSKQTYYDDFGLGISVSSSKAELRKWKSVAASDTGHSDATEDAYRYVGIVEMPASQLTYESPTITVYNEDNEQKIEQVAFPDVNVLLEDKTYWTNTTVRNLNYTVEKPVINEKTAESEEDRDAYLEDGYSVATKRQETERILEEHVKVQDAEYEQVERDFSSKMLRGMFLESRQGWYPAGTTQEQVTRTRTSTSWQSASTAKWRTEWYDGNRWNGEYTGQSREIVVDPAEYQTQKQYQYEVEVQKTGTRTATYTRTVQIPHTGTQTVTECIPGHGCYTTTTTYTYYTTETRTYTATYTYTYTVTRTKTYWAASRQVTHHSPTGDIRRVKIEDPEYETQYEIEQKEEYTTTVNRYVAARDKLVRPPQYEWQERHSTTDSMLARRLASRDDWQIGESTTNTEWVLRKQTGTTRRVTSQFQNESHVVETSATVHGDRVQQYYNVKTGEKVVKSTERKSEEKTLAGARSLRDIRRLVTGTGETDEECELKDLCYIPKGISKFHIGST